jgi:prevent-host-death family protein
MDLINVVEARKSFSELLARVAFGGSRIIVERRGKPMAALISIEDLQRLETLERECGAARERGLAALEKARGARRRMAEHQTSQPSVDAGDLIREVREERMDELDDLR